MMAMFSMTLTFYLSKNNMMGLTIAIEVMLLTVTVQLIQISGIYNDVYGTMYGMVIMLLAGAESAMGTSITVAYYRIRGKVTTTI
uniref:NADH-ubiquinone oxidoreductase chain 4L n=1 Tax=Candida verbasci TaxID=1227364 RepID=A0A977LL03_9ASCO|nr:NADH dehydrogenase subunit 4L [Candida verbasci]UXG56604.1 NADH dehydrogenase subunit 4L [Candida verbasci]